MALYALTVMKNEANRYLESFLQHHAGMFDGHAFYDDQSTDRSVQIVNDLGDNSCLAGVREDHEPSFLEHEGQFRQNAWNWAENLFCLQEGDWVLSIDADEMLMTQDLTRVCNWAFNEVICFSIPEVFMVDVDGAPWVRTDGYWGNLSGPRMCKWKGYPFGTYNDLSMACGSLPAYYDSMSYGQEVTPDATILHYGYAKHEDRLAKYQRYNGLPGHNPKHIESIMQKPTLEKWEGTYPVMV